MHALLVFMRSTANQAGPWPVQVELALASAATLCAEHGVDLEAWMKAAWTAYVEARPGLREELEDARLAAELANLRDAGRLPQA